jgi:uncharacterized repeat protein (TIGR01451 family)
MNVVEQKITYSAVPIAGAFERTEPRRAFSLLGNKILKSVSVGIGAAVLSTATWAACTGIAVDVGYDFDLGAKTGLAPADAGICLAGSSAVTPGDDYCAGNTTNNASGDFVIRTNDSGVATLKYTINAGVKIDNYTIVSTIPQTGSTGASSTRPAGLDIAVWTGLPPFCSGPGSAISNGGRTLTCNLGTIDRTGLGQQTIAIPAPFKISGRALNGETFALQSTESSSGGSEGVCSVQPTVAAQPLVVSARPKIDVKTSIANYSPTTLGGVQGYYMDYFVYIDGLNGATVGGEAVKSPLEFNVGLGNDVPVTGVQYIGLNQVANGGSTVFSSTAATGSPAGNGIKIPVTMAPNNAGCTAEFLIPGGACQEEPTNNPARLSTHSIRYFVPTTAFPNGVNQINFNNFLNSDTTSGPAAITTPPASGTPGTFTEPVSENNAPYSAVRTLPGSYAKYTAQFAETNTTRPPGSPADSPATLNEPGGQSSFNWCVGGSCKQYPTKNVESLIQLVNRGPVDWDSSNGGTIVCDKFDNSGMVLTPKPRNGGTAAEFPTNTPGDVIVAIRSFYGGNGAMPEGFTVQVATAAGTPVGGGYPSNSQNCGDADATWVTPPAGDLSAYNLVRIKIPRVINAFTAGGDVVVAPVFFFTVPLNAPNGKYIGNQLKIQAGAENFGGTGPGSWSSGTFDPLTNNGVYTGERFQVVKALVRTQKDALDSTGNPTTLIGAGKTVTFKLSPSYTAAPGVPSPNSDISVVDVLPLPLTYVPGTARGGSPTAALEPNSITLDGSGRQVLTWVLPGVVLNSAIPPIFIDVRAPTTTPNGTVATNVVTVAAPLVDQSTDAERSAIKAVTVSNVAGLYTDKLVSSPIIPRNGTYSYTLSIGNLRGSPQTNADIIDVLPRSASPVNVPVNNFAGTAFLTGPIVVPAGATAYYTNAAPGAPPTALNSTIGGAIATPVDGDFNIAATQANGWCTFAQIGQPGCPATLAAVTGFRVIIPSIGANAVENLIVPMGTAGNVETNIYTNRFAARGTGLPALFSNDVVTRVKQAKISGKVFVDTNLNSQPTAGEPSIAGVTVTLTGTDSAGLPVNRTTVTDANGNYAFDDLFPGTYNVTETQPAAYGSAGTNLPGSAGGTAPTPNSFTAIPLVVGQDGTNYNFGEIGSSLAGKVCEDLNNDGKCTAAEPPIEGVLITLTGTDSGGNAVTRTATTTATGDWKIADLGNPDATGYTLTETQPAGYLDGKQSPGLLTPLTGTDPSAAVGVTTPLVAGNDAITGIKFTQGTNGTTYDFAEVKPASLQGFVYYDLNKDGTRTTATPEPGIPGVVLELTGTNDLGQPVALTTTTSVGPDGSYTFSNLRPGNYTVREVQPVAPAFTVVDGTVTVGSVAYTTAPVAPAANNGAITTETAGGTGVGEAVGGIVLGSGGNGTNYNFGEVPLVPVSGRVFVDKNYGGTFDPATETGLPNNAVTTLTLCRTATSPCDDVVTTTTTTPGSGTYTFPPQPSGAYYVVETQPVGYASSSPNIQTVTLVATPVTDVNFAETGANLSGTVYSDNNANGTLDAPDAGIAGVQMKLCLASSLPLCSTPVSTATTSVGGTYTFADIPAPPAGDSYVVVENETTGILTTYNNGTATAGLLSSNGGSGLVAGNVVLGEQGPAFTADSKINGISFVMPTAVTTGSAPVVGSGYNFGEIPLAGISGRVFVDRNFTNGTTGTYDPATDGPLLNGGTTTITLCRVDPALTAGVCPSASVEATTSTLPDGNYNFPVVPAGNYWVVETQPVGYGSSSPNVVPVTRTGNTAVTGINFADTLAEIRGTVYKDDNGSGALNGAEPGIAGVTVKLCLSNDTACATPVKTATTSTPGGTYTFTDLPAPPVGQTYFIKEEQSTVPATLQNGTTTVGALAVGGAAAAPVGTANTPGNTINGITWTPSQTPVNGLSALGTDYNFGELPTTTISGAVILDKDFSGTQTPGDTGLPVTTTVTLCRSAPAHGSACPPADVVTTTTTTPGSGTYTFPTVTPGTYYVVETQPVGYASSSPNTSAPVLVTTTPITGVNFYETGARLSGTVYKDVDYSGTNNAGDIPLPGVTVRICSTANCAAGSVVATTTTSATGLYQFNDLPAPPAGQSYFIVEDQATVPPTPTVLADGTTTVGTFALVGTGGTSAPGTAVQTPSRFEGVTWTPPTSVQPAGAPAVAGTNFNFGEIDGFDVGGKVFLDTNRNGSLDSPSDTPLAGIPMTLCRVATVPCPPASIAGTTTTSITGDYTFPRVPPGDYFVQETQPPGYGSVPTPAAPTATDVRPIKVAGANITGINFADTLSSIAGLVYRDDDGSQTRNGAETTMPPGITITLTGVDATGAAVTRTTVTNASGTYVFDNLKTGTYTITETQPADFGNGGANPGTLAGGTGGPNSNRITNIQLPVNTDAPNYNFGDVPKVAGVAGTVWRDNDHDRQRDADEPVLPGWTVQVLRTPVGGGTPTLVATTVSDANGAYSVTGLEAGGGYSVRFIAPGGAIFGGAVDGEQGTPISGASVARGEITNLTLTATVTGAPNIIPQQSLPVDPSGVVYDSDTRLPVPGAQVRFEPVNCPAFDPALHLVGGAANQTQTVGPDGFYQFLLNNGAPACQYRIVVIPPGAYLADPAIPPQAGPFSPPPRPGVALIVPNSRAPQDSQPTTYFLNFNLNPNSQDVVNNHIPLVARVRPVLFVTKVANKSKVELGDTVKYTVKVRYASGTNNLTEVKVVDTMPAGFKLIADTSFVSVPTGAPAVQLAAANITGAPGAVVTYNIPVPGAGLAPGAEVELTYRVRVAVGSMQGDGINRAQARSGALRSNIAQAKVIVDPGVFTNDGCVAGKVFVDCNNNHIQDAEELGVPNVRMYMEDGTYFITDSEGKYNYCGLSPKSHVITIDMLTMPRGSRLTTTSNRNLGDANSMFLDVKNGQLIRADFAEGSCSNTVLEQVKARRTQGEVRSTDTEKKGQPALKWEGKSPQYPQQGTDGANQPLVVPRTTNGGAESAPEQNTPVPQMPGASSNTQGANVRNAK